MKNKILSLVLAAIFLVPFNAKVSAAGPEDGLNSSGWFSPTVIVCGIAAAVSVGYAGYRVYDYHCFKNKIIKIDGSSWDADALGNRINPRDDLNLQRYIQDLLRVEIPKLKNSDKLEARHLANIKRSFTVINLDLERRINTEESRRVAAYLRNESEYLVRIMDRQKSIRVGDLIEELKKIDDLARQATVLIDRHLYQR